VRRIGEFLAEIALHEEYTAVETPSDLDTVPRAAFARWQDLGSLSLARRTGNIFRSYRREDTATAARLLRDHLAPRLGPQHVFIDTESILPGVDFLQAIERTITQSAAQLVLIGPTWVTMQDSLGRRRL